jgi:mono/diheme cytochrome c family protein
VKRLLFAFVVVAAFLAAAVALLNLRGEDPVLSRAEEGDARADLALVERGRYLALAGNCAGCHTAPGGEPFAGGVGIETPFGTVFASNITPHAEAGIGLWSSSAFWRAMHNGRSLDGRLLYPAFPYPNYTRITREDSDAIFAWLRTLPAVDRPNTPNTLRFPYDSQIALAAWRALFFSPGTQQADPSRSAPWNRGAYLVNGLGHCNACHSGRNLFGAPSSGTLDLGGGLIPVQNWYAPSLSAREEAGVADWALPEIVDLLGTGVSVRGSAIGPMADVVRDSTRHLAAADLEAIAAFLQSLPGEPPPARAPAPPAGDFYEGTMRAGRKVYEDHCAACHGDDGKGIAGAYPALSHNRAVTMDPPANVVHVVLLGGFPPSTAGNPRPFGMPPFATALTDAEIAAVLTMVRNSWGNAGAPVTTVEVRRYRSGSAAGG